MPVMPACTGRQKVLTLWCRQTCVSGASRWHTSHPPPLATSASGRTPPTQMHGSEQLCTGHSHADLIDWGNRCHQACPQHRAPAGLEDDSAQRVHLPWDMMAKGWYIHPGLMGWEVMLTRLKTPLSGHMASAGLEGSMACTAFQRHIMARGQYLLHVLEGHGFLMLGVSLPPLWVPPIPCRATGVLCAQYGPSACMHSEQARQDTTTYTVRIAENLPCHASRLRRASPSRVQCSCLHTDLRHTKTCMLHGDHAKRNCDTPNHCTNCTGIVARRPRPKHQEESTMLDMFSPSLPLCLFWVRGLRYHCAFSFPNHLRVSVRLMNTDEAA